MQQLHILHCTFRFYNCTNCDQLHVKICPGWRLIIPKLISVEATAIFAIGPRQTGKPTNNEILRYSRFKSTEWSQWTRALHTKRVWVPSTPTTPLIIYATACLIILRPASPVSEERYCDGPHSFLFVRDCAGTGQYNQPEY